MKLNCFRITLLVLATALNFCGVEPIEKVIATPEKFSETWDRGLAELAAYDLQQVRYGQIHTGDAVLIFVTEDFVKDKQVKHEFGDDLETMPILKMNYTKKFNTGIYPYSIMISTFTPRNFEEPRTLKATASIQEWCGQTYTQLNYRSGEYETVLHSYFQSEGDREFELDGRLEDEIWSRIRINPQTLKTGSFKLIPSLEFTRLHHYKPKPEKVEASLNHREPTSEDLPGVFTYKVVYKNIKRVLEIQFEDRQPFVILGWQETVESGFGNNKKEMTTVATLKGREMLDYWNKNSPSDRPLRTNLGLSEY